MVDDYDINKIIADYKAKKEQETYDINKRIDEYKAKKEQENSAPISKIFRQLEKEQEYAKSVEGTELDTQDLAIKRKLSPEDMAFGMGMSGIKNIAKPGISLLDKAIEYIRAKKLERAAKAIDKPLHHPVSGEEFANIVDAASKVRKDVAENVTKYTPEEYSKMQTFLSPDKKSGYAIKPDGELVSVFSSEKGLGRGDKIVQDAIQSGATKLDAFEPYLPKLYEKHGFQEFKREPNWTPGGPDVVYMARPGSKELQNIVKKQLPTELPKELQYTPEYAPDAPKETLIDRIINVNAAAKESEQVRKLREAEEAAKELKENLKITNDPVEDINEITKKIK